MVSSCEGQFLTTTHAPHSFAWRNMRKRSRKSGVGRRLFRLDACEQRRILKLNADRLNWLWRSHCWLTADVPIDWFFLKFVTDASSDPGAMMSEIVWLRRLILCLISWPKFSRYELTLQRLRIWIGDGLAPSSPFINRLNILGESKLCHLLWETSIFFHCCFTGSPCIIFSSSDGEMKKMMIELPLFGSLVGTICQSLWWACHNTSVVVTGLHRWGQLLGGTLRLELTIWFRVAQFLGGEWIRSSLHIGWWGRKRELFDRVCWWITSHPEAWTSSSE